MPTRLPAAFGGAVLRAFFAAMLRVRRPRPIHAQGLVLEGEVSWVGSGARAGISWIDQAPDEPARVVGRVSRSVGLPSWAPDVIGLALRVQTPTGPADLELASTGFGVPGRFLLAPCRRPTEAPYGTLMPYRGERGPILLAARSEPGQDLPADLPGMAAALRARPWRLRLYFAAPTGKWHRFADVVLRYAGDPDDPHLRFDAVRRPIPGAGTYRWVRLLRQPSYRLVQTAG